MTNISSVSASSSLPAHRTTAPALPRRWGRILLALKNHEGKGVERVGEASPARWKLKGVQAAEVSIKPLLGRLPFTTAKRNWGHQLRFGLFEISSHDMAVIAEAMGVALSPA